MALGRAQFTIFEFTHSVLCTAIKTPSLAGDFAIRVARPEASLLLYIFNNNIGRTGTWPHVPLPGPRLHLQAVAGARRAESAVSTAGTFHKTTCTCEL